ncbi:MAG: radical SAM protein, partial [Cyclobacteriaceae bacterium]|nr:radical SAM protein [Cyclobacteriaceae bacterium]
LKKYRVISKQRPVAPIITSRGCAHECTFCSKDVFKRKVTFRSAENVLKEIDFLVKNYGIRQIDILDDNFMQKRSRVEEILDGLISRNYGLSINLPSGVRIEQIDRALLKKMRKAGFYKIAFGVESADPEVLKRVRKKLDLQKLALTVKTAKELGFETYGFFVIGLPGETEESFNQTLDYACNTGFDVANFCIAIPFVGTELFDLVQKHGRFLMSTTGNLNEGFYGGKAFYELGSVKESDVVRRYKTAYKRFYTWKKKIQLLSKIRSIQDIYWLYNAFKSIT